MKKTDKTHHAYTPIEDDLIRQIYPTGGSVACAKVMPNRTPLAIQSRAHRLGIGFGERYLPEFVPSALNQAMDEWGVITRKGNLVAGADLRDWQEVIREAA
jgi:hypothetical protein